MGNLKKPKTQPITQMRTFQVLAILAFTAFADVVDPKLDDYCERDREGECIEDDRRLDDYPEDPSMNGCAHRDRAGFCIEDKDVNEESSEEGDEESEEDRLLVGENEDPELDDCERDRKGRCIDDDRLLEDYLTDPEMNGCAHRDRDGFCIEDKDVNEESSEEGDEESEEDRL